MSCWPLVCASAKKPSHKGLNIDKLTSKPVIKTNKAAESQGWISWLLGIDLSFGHEEEMQDEEEAAQYLNDAQEDVEEYEELEVISSFKYEDLTKEEETASYESDEPLEPPSWYSVNLLGDEDWFSVDLLGSDYPKIDGRDWWEVDLLGNDNTGLWSWATVDMFGLSGGRAWYEVDWLGSGDTDHEATLVCAEVDHDTRAWYEVSWLGWCDDGVKRWYHVDLLGDPTVQQGFYNDDEDGEPPEEVSPFGVNLLGEYYKGLDDRLWYEVDLYGDIVIPEIEDEEDIEEIDSGFEVHIEEEEMVEKEESKPEKPKTTTPAPTPAPVKKIIKEPKQEAAKPGEKEVKEKEPKAEKPVATPKQSPKEESTKPQKKTEQTPSPSPSKPPKPAKRQEAKTKTKVDPTPKPAEKKTTPSPKYTLSTVAKHQKVEQPPEPKEPEKKLSETAQMVKENRNVLAFFCEYFSLFVS